MVELLRLVDDDVAPSISEMKSEKQRKACVVWGFKSSLCTQRDQPIRAVREKCTWEVLCTIRPPIVPRQKYVGMYIDVFLHGELYVCMNDRRNEQNEVQRSVSHK